MHVAISVFVWTFTLTLEIVDFCIAPSVFVSYAQSLTVLETTISVSLSSCYFIASIAFLIYGILVYQYVALCNHV
jgi:hypothetical protein